MNTPTTRIVEFREGREVAPGTCIPLEDLDGAAVLADVETFITRYVVLPQPARLPVALWAIATHAAAIFDSFPYICFSSPLPRCGKTRAIEVLEFLVREPWRGTTPSEAGLFRFLATGPTLLLDEVEGLSARRKSERDQAVISILNCGYRKGATVLQWDARARHAEKLPVYGPKAFCCIADLPPTLADRSIVVHMERRRPEEAVARFRFSRAQQESVPILKSVAEIVGASHKDLAAVYAALPELRFISDRDEELYAPLFAVCSVFAPARLEELQRCAKTLCAGKAGDAEDNSLALRLLSDLKHLWPAGGLNWLTAEMLTALKAEPESPWSGDYDLNPRRLARMLRPFGAEQRQVRTATGAGKGYVLSEIEGAFVRYLEPER